MRKVLTQQADIDRGWAWVVMAATYLGMVVYCAALYMSGVIFIVLLDRYGEGETKTSLVGAVSSGLLCFTAPLAGIINNKYSCRTSIVLGGFLTTVGFASSAFVPDLNWLIFTGGIVCGLGYGISSSGLICALGFYFEKWRDTVLSTAFLTVGIAMFASAPLALYLFAEYGFTATFLIIASAQAQMCVIGALCKPSLLEKEVQNEKKVQRIKRLSRSKSYIDVTVLKNVSYVCFLLSTAVWNFALYVAITHLPNYISKLGGSYGDIGLLMSSFSLANLIGRLCGALTLSKLHVKSIYVHVTVLGFTGILSALFVFYSKLTGGPYIFTIQLGLFSGWPNAMMTPLSLSFVGVEKLSEAYGLAYFFGGIGVSTGPVLIGYLYSVTGSYESSFIVAGAVLMAGSLFGCCSLRSQCKNKQEVVNEFTIDEVQNALDSSLQQTDDMVPNGTILIELNGQIVSEINWSKDFSNGAEVNDGEDLSIQQTVNIDSRALL